MEKSKYSFKFQQAVYITAYLCLFCLSRIRLTHLYIFDSSTSVSVGFLLGNMLYQLQLLAYFDNFIPTDKTL